jgi:hypothetical protein
VTVRLEDATRPELLTVLRSLLQERDELQRRIDELELAHERLRREHAAVERDHAVGSHLQVAGRLLHRSLDRRQVLTAILEICINLVGCEEIALFERGGDGERLGLIASFGVDEAAWASVAIDAGAIGQAAATASIQLAGGDSGDGTPVACVPLCVERHVVGVLVLFRLLPHKAGFEPVDLALFDLLREEGGVALAASAESA